MCVNVLNTAKHIHRQWFNVHRHDDDTTYPQNDGLRFSNVLNAMHHTHRIKDTT